MLSLLQTVSVDEPVESPMTGPWTWWGLGSCNSRGAKGLPWILLPKPPGSEQGADLEGFSVMKTPMSQKGQGHMGG